MIEQKDTAGKLVMVENPAYEEWFASDHQVLVQVASVKTAAEAWKAIGDIVASHMRAWTVNVHLALATTKKDNLTIAQYYGKMKGFADEMAAAGKPLDDEELVAFILNGFDSDCNALTSALVTRVEPIPLPELYSQLLSFETRLELQQGGGSPSSVNSAGRGGRGNGQQRNYGGQQMRGHRRFNSGHGQG